MGQSLMTELDGIEFRQVTVPFISTVDKAIEAVRKIDLVAAQEGVRPVVFSTLVQEDVRNVVRGSTGFFLDFFDPFLAPLARGHKHQKNPHPGKHTCILGTTTYLPTTSVPEFSRSRRF